METNYKITVPKPCHEDWNAMSPNETGRFCNSCVKSVVDFSSMEATEIQGYFIKNQGKSVCGRFKAEQLDSIIIQIPKDVLFSQVRFHRMFLLALLISMGTTLFSCQNSNGSRQNIDKVEVVDSTAPNHTLGIILPKKDIQPEIGDSTITAEPKKQLEVPVKKKHSPTIMGDTIPYLSGVVAVEPVNTKPVVIDKNFVYMANAVQVQPTFPWGMAKFYHYVTSNLKVPEDSQNTTARIFLSFIINADGSLSDIKIVRGINPALDTEALRVIKESPKWIAGEQNGQKVRVSYVIPIKITAKE